MNNDLHIKIETALDMIEKSIEAVKDAYYAYKSETDDDLDILWTLDEATTDLKDAANKIVWIKGGKKDDRQGSV